MDQITMMKEVDRIRGFRSKATWDEVGLAPTPEFLAELKQFTSAELGIESQLGNTFTRTPDDKVFLLGHKGGLYLVLTGGYDYARNVRYIGTLIDKPVPDTLEYVLQAFDNNGMNMRGPKPGETAEADGLETATFIGISPNGKEMYRCTFTDAEGEPDSATAFVWEEDGKKVADF